MRTGLALIGVTLLLTAEVGHAAATASTTVARIVIDPTPGRRIPPAFFGAGMSEWPVTRIDARYGWGLWDPDRKQNPEEPITLARQAGVKTLRLLAMWHQWEEGLAIPGGNPNKLPFGVDEWMRTCEAIGAEPIIGTDYIYESTDEVVHLVRYLNDEADDELLAELQCAGTNLDEEGRADLYGRFGRDEKGEHRWGNLRAINGHAKPYQVKYIEIGNETYLYLPADRYIAQYLAFYRDLKAADPRLQVGVVLAPLGITHAWNDFVLGSISTNVDFGAIHYYATPYIDVTKETAETVLGVTVMVADLEGSRCVGEAAAILRKYAGRRVPLAITEFNSGFCGPQDPKSYYQHALGTALANAEMIRAFMSHPDVFTANHFTLVNGFNGMSCNGFTWGEPGRLYDVYWKRPNYYVLELYRRYFGDTLLEVQTTCPGYDLERYAGWLGQYERGVRTVGTNLLADRTWTVEVGEGVEVQTGRELRITFSDPPNLYYGRIFKDCPVDTNRWYVVSGWAKADNLDTWASSAGFRLDVTDIRGYDMIPWVSKTAELKGTTPWIYIETHFKSFPDMHGVRVFAGVPASHPPLRGTVSVKDVAFRLAVADPYPSFPYLAAHASLSRDRRTVYLMVVNRSMEQSIAADITVRGMPPAGPVRTHTLWADDIDATNESPPHDAVSVEDREVDTCGQDLRSVFPKHSLTAIEWPVARAP
ncbi:MAG: alpha-L-arabinofuranosidase C-terminal domain-containing protein [bacterium]